MCSLMGQGYVFWPVQGCRLPRENELEVQGEARLGSCQSLALLLGGWYSARTHGPWECSGEDLGPWKHPMISVPPDTRLCSLPPLGAGRVVRELALG